MSIDNKSLAHTIWNCKYHIVFASKYRKRCFIVKRDERNEQYLVIFYFKYISKTVMSAGFTPEILLAIPIVSGLISFNFSLASSLSPSSFE